MTGTDTSPADLHLTHLTWQPLTRDDPTIEDLTLVIPAGQRVLLTGESGSGKSTVLRALAGLLDPEDGDGEGLPAAPRRAGERALLLQNPVDALIAATVARDVAFGPENVCLPRPRIHRAVAGAMAAAAVDLEPERGPLDASGGQQQRVALAGALALAPSVLLLDEPCSMLDPPTAEAVRSAILESARGRTLVVADHDLDHWRDHVDRVVVLGPRARVLADGPPVRVPAREHALQRPAGVAVPADAAGPAEPAEPAHTREAPVVASLRGVAVPARGLAAPLDLEVRAGRITVLTGPSGAGKSTLLGVVLGEQEHTGGDVHRPSPERVAAVPQDPAHSFVAPSVRTELLASPWADDADRAEDLLERAGLMALADENPHRLSGGEQRRTAIAAALAQDPALLVLDEPTVGLDAARRDAVLELLRDAAADGCAVLVASHDPAVVAAAHHRLDLPAHPPVPLRAARRIPADALNPLTLGLIGILAAIGSFAVSSPLGGLAALAPTVLLAPLAIRGPRAAAVRVLPMLLTAASLAWTTALLGTAPALSREAWLLGVQEALRLTAFVAPGVLALGSVQPTALGDALGQRLRLPARGVVAVTVALVRAAQLGRVWRTILGSRLRRGLGRPASPRLLAGSTLGLLVATLRGAEQQALAMDARGFAGATRRTWAEPSPLGPADAAGLGIALTLLVWPALAELLLR